MAARPAAATQPLRGRDAELAVIDAALGQARDGRGGVLLVEGGAGLGKSRLLEEAMRLAGRAGLRAAVGRADVDDNAVPLAPLMSACFGGNAPLLGSDHEGPTPGDRSRRHRSGEPRPRLLLLNRRGRTDRARLHPPLHLTSQRAYPPPIRTAAGKGDP